jgi:hypothetical protein
MSDISKAIEDTEKKLKYERKHYKCMQDAYNLNAQLPFGNYTIEDIEKEADKIKSLEIILEALRHMEAINNPQPLTEAQIKERKGKPIFIDAFGEENYWDICTGDTDNYNEIWIAYDHEPGEPAAQKRENTCDTCIDDYTVATFVELRGYNYCPKCGRKLDHEPKEEQQ